MLQGAHERALNEEVDGVEPAPKGFPVSAELVRSCFEEEPLQGGIELPNGLFFVDSRIALKAFHHGVEGTCQGLRKLRFAATGRAFNQNRLPELSGDVHLGERDFIDDVLGFLELPAELINRREHVGLYPQPGFYGKTRFSPKTQFEPLGGPANQLG